MSLRYKTASRLLALWRVLVGFLFKRAMTKKRKILEREFTVKETKIKGKGSLYCKNLIRKEPVVRHFGN